MTRKIEKVKAYVLDSIASKMKKDFGSIRKGEEGSYFMQLFVIEEVLLKAYLKNSKINSRRAKEAINVCLLKTKGYINSVEYDFQGLVEEESLSIAESLSKAFIPFDNEELYDVLKDKINFESHDEIKKYFQEPIQCLIRIYDSIEYWEKSAGLHGYFEFLKEQILDQIDINSDKVNFVVNYIEE